MARGFCKFVDAPVSSPLPYGLLSAATVLDITDVHELNCVDWVDSSCGEAHPWDDVCNPDSPGESPGESPGSPASGEKVFDRPTSRSAGPIHIYAGEECSTIGRSLAEAKAGARAKLLLGEQKALEEAVQINYLTGGDDQLPVNDLSPASGNVGVVAGLSTLEQYLAEHYGGQGVILAPTALGAWFSRYNLVHREGARQTTLVGNRVAFGAGFGLNIGPSGPAEPGTAWMFATGPITIRREPVNTLPEVDNQAINIRYNDRYVLAERTYLVQISCVVEAIKVDLCAE